MLSTILSRYWWMTLIRGAIAILFGIMLFVWPQISLVSLVLVFGAFALADGVANVVTAIGGRQEHESWWVLLLAGLAGIGIGVLTFFNPAVTALALLFYIAIWAIATGLLEIVAAIRLRKEIEGEFWLALSGLASVAFGMILVARPGAGALAVLWLIGAYAIAFGAMLLVLAFKARGFVKRVKAAVSTS
ncbi:MAG: HdeD family acid-resistance protein [Vicinamibacteria bacterium]